MTEEERRVLLARLEASIVEARAMTPEQARARLHAEGLITADGKLDPAYGG